MATQRHDSMGPPNGWSRSRTLKEGRQGSTQLIRAESDRIGHLVQEFVALL